MQLDDFGEYMKAKREELGATPAAFWSEYLWTLANVAGWAALSAGVAIAGPSIVRFFGQ